MTLKGKPIELQKKYKVASWAPVAEGASGEPNWDVVVKYLRDKKVIRPPRLNRPQLIGVKGNPGIAQVTILRGIQIAGVTRKACSAIMPAVRFPAPRSERRKRFLRSTRNPGRAPPCSAGNYARYPSAAATNRAAR